MSVDRFWKKVDRSAGAEACWPWTASRTTKGYGNFRMSSPRCMRLAHRVAFFLINGTWPKVVRHACDNPPCCNPKHLLAGTYKDNTADMDERERRASCSGERNHNARLTEDGVRKIRELASDGVHPGTIATMFGIRRKTVQGIIRRERWQHV